jgi:DNA-binding response OmpR family regulator
VPALASKSAGAVTYNGITIDVAGGTIEFRHKSAKTKPRIALLAALLARASPNPVGQEFLVKRVWAGTRIPADAHEVLDQFARELRDLVSPIDLEIKITQGVGIGLRAAE